MKSTKPRPPRKQQLNTRMIVKGFGKTEEVPYVSKRQQKRMDFIDREVTRLA